MDWEKGSTSSIAKNNDQSNGNIYPPLSFENELENIGKLMDSKLLHNLETFFIQLRTFNKICVFGQAGFAI